MPKLALPLKQHQELTIKNLKTSCIIGVWESEKLTPQPLVIDLKLVYEDKGAMHSDELSDTIDYSDLTRKLLSFVEQQSFQLLEALSYRLAQFIFENFSVLEIELILHKPNALKNLANISHQACYRT